MKINAMSEVALVFFMEAVTEPMKRLSLWSLCDLVEETIELYQQELKPLPPPTAGRDYANKMLNVA